MHDQPTAPNRFTWSGNTPGFSPALAQCHPPVRQIFGAGEVSCVTNLATQPGLAIIGSRNASPQGLADAKWFARKASEAGLTIVSGLAQGIDGAAHQGALDAAGKTVAVLGHGLAHLYPPQHRELGQAIVKQGGALVSEFEEQVPPLAFHFPLRNRIIAALSRAILIIEAAPKSGSLITARHALDLGIDVFVIPGSIHQLQSMGSNSLIRQGAQPVQSPQELLADLGLGLDSAKKGAEHHGPQTLSLAPEDPRCRALAGVLDFHPAHVEDLSRGSGLSEADVFAGLLLLELAGVAKRRSDGRWSIYRDHRNS